LQPNVTLALSTLSNDLDCEKQFLVKGISMSPTPVLLEDPAEQFFEMLKRGGPGRIMGLVRAFCNKGMGDIVSSWILEGPKLRVTGAQVQLALGKDQITSIAAALGIPLEAMPGKLAEWLPSAVSKLTPKNAS
jgi:uncharacterized protein YidB (DUF937 family)